MWGLGLGDPGMKDPVTQCILLGVGGLQVGLGDLGGIGASIPIMVPFLRGSTVGLHHLAAHPLAAPTCSASGRCPGWS